MRPTEIAAHLEGFEGRGAGTDAERRAAQWLADQVSAGGREVIVEPFWCRPSWALAHAWHVVLGLAGSLIATASAPVGGALVLASLVSVLADELIGISPGRRLTPERASQNVVAVPMRRGAETGPGRVRLVIAANYDAGRAGLAYRNGLRAIFARLRCASRGLVPGWLGWLAIANVWLLAMAILRIVGHHSRLVGVAQLPPTVGLLLGLALLIELAISDFAPAAGDNGTGVAAALTLARALDVSPPGNLDVEVVLEGAGDGGQIGMRRYLRARRRERRPSDTVVLGIAACSGGNPRWWVSDGSLLPRRYARPLTGLAAAVASREPYLQARPHRGRGVTPAFPARRRRLPALAIGCLDQHGLAPRSHQRSDTAAEIDADAVDAAVQFGLMLVDAIDASVASAGRPASPAPA